MPLYFDFQNSLSIFYSAEIIIINPLLKLFYIFMQKKILLYVIFQTPYPILFCWDNYFDSIITLCVGRWKRAACFQRIVVGLRVIKSHNVLHLMIWESHHLPILLPSSSFPSGLGFVVLKTSKTELVLRGIIVESRGQWGQCV